MREVVKEFKKNHIDVTILASNPGSLSEVEVIEGVNVYRIKARWFTRISQWCDDNKHRKSSNVIRTIALLINRLRMILSFPTWPLVSPLYAYRYYKKALQLNQMNDYDGILSVYTPIDALIAGALVRRKYSNVKLVLYFLDCFSGGVVPRHLTRQWLEKRGYKWETRLFDIADMVFVMASHERHYSKDRYDKFRDKIRVVDIPLMRELKPKPDKGTISLNAEVVNIVYTGSIIKSTRDPVYMLETFKLIDKPDQYRFHIYGGGDCHDIIAGYIEEGRGIPITQHGLVDPDTAIGAMLEGDILVNIGSSVDTMIPSKIFEYMAAGKPIISFYKYETEPSIPYLEKYPLALLIREDWNELHSNAELIVKFMDKHKGKTTKYDEIASGFPANTPKILVSHVLKLM